MKATQKIALLKDAIYCACIWAIATLLWGIYNTLAYDRFDVGSMWMVFALLATGIYAALYRFRIQQADEMRRRRIRRMPYPEEEEAWKN